MRQYVWVTPWCPSLSCASTFTVYFQAFGMMSAINFWSASLMCLCSSPLTCLNRLALCFGALPFDNCLEMHLQNGSVLCIWSRASCLSSVRGFSVISWVVFTVVKSGVTVSLTVWVLEVSVFMVVWHWCDVFLLVLNAGLLEMVAMSILIVALLLLGSLTNLDRQSVALFHAPEIHSNVML